jgi:hypothetical protein
MYSYRSMVNSKLNYWFDMTNIRFFSINLKLLLDPLNSKHDGIKEYIIEVTSWLEEELRVTNKLWKIVSLHYPMYCPLNHIKADQDKVDCNDLIPSNAKKELERIFQEYKVDIVFSGYGKNYERTKIKVEQGAHSPLYVGCGSGGHMNISPMKPKESNANPKNDRSDFDYSLKDITGYCSLRIEDGLLNLEYFGQFNGDEKGFRVWDRIIITKGVDHSHTALIIRDDLSKYQQVYIVPHKLIDIK